MKVLVLGTGLMGPAAAFDAMADPDVTRVGLAEARAEALDACMARLRRHPGADKLVAVRQDVADEASARALISGYDVVVSAVSSVACARSVRAALRARRPVVTLTAPPAAELPAPRDVEARAGLVALGCGLEPGLTEIVARWLAERLDEVEELHIKCGGIPERPAPPLGYKIVFGGRQLPLRESDVPTVEDGRVRQVARYSGVEPVVFPGVGECEAWHDGFRVSLLELPPFRSLRIGTQKTVRWPGYAAKATLLKELGLLSQTPVEVDGVPVVPKRLLDAVLYPRVRLAEGERDVTVFRVEALGQAAGARVRYTVEMVDRMDEATGFTSMARTTGFTAAIVTRMIARGEVKAMGIRPPEQLVAGPLYERLLAALEARGVRFATREDRVPAVSR